MKGREGQTQGQGVRGNPQKKGGERLEVRVLSLTRGNLFAIIREREGKEKRAQRLLKVVRREEILGFSALI